MGSRYVSVSSSAREICWFLSLSYREKDAPLHSSVAIRVGTNAEGAEAAEGKHRAADSLAVFLLCKRYVQSAIRGTTGLELSVINLGLLLKYSTFIQSCKCRGRFLRNLVYLPATNALASAPALSSTSSLSCTSLGCCADIPLSSRKRMTYISCPIGRRRRRRVSTWLTSLEGML